MWVSGVVLCAVRTNVVLLVLAAGLVDGVAWRDADFELCVGAAIDREVCTGDVGRFRAGHEGNERGDFGN